MSNIKKEAIMKVFRFNPEKDSEPKFVEYCVPFEEGASVLLSLRYIYENLDASLAYRDYFCKTNQCGMCLMQINGKIAYACNRKMEDNIKVEPFPNRRVIRDLVVDFQKLQ